MKTESKNYLWASLVSFAVLAVYSGTLYPGVAGGDSGELIANACALGVAHPPGYPLYTLLAHLWTELPFKNPAWNVNLFSALLNSLAAGLLFDLVRRITRNASAGLAAASFFAFTPLVWSHAVSAEVFPLNNLFVALLFWLHWKYFTSERKFPVAAASFFTAGLGMSNHHTLLFVALPLLGWILWDFFRSRQPLSKSLLLIGAGFSGLLPYSYLPWAGSRHLIVSWGDTDTWLGFWRHFLRSEYGTLQLASQAGESQFLQATVLYARTLFTEFLGVGLALAAIGIAGGWRKKISPDPRPAHLKTFLRLTVGIFFFYLLVFHALSNLDLKQPLYEGIMRRFWQQPQWILCMWLGLGIASLPDHWLKLRLSRTAGLLAFVLPPLVFFSSQNQSRNITWDQAGREALSRMPPSSIFLPLGDSDLGVVRYLQACENLRPDIQIIGRSLLGYPWTQALVTRNYPGLRLPPPGFSRFDLNRSEGFQLADFLRANSQFPVFISNLGPREEQNWRSEFDLWPMGWVDRVVGKTKPLEMGSYLRESSDFWKKVNPLPIHTMDQTSWEYYFLQRFAESETRRADLLIRHALQAPPEQARFFFEQAAQIMENVLSSPLQAEANRLKMLGFIWSQLIPNHPQAPVKTIAAWTRYLAIANPQDPELEAVRNSLRAVEQSLKNK